MLKFIPTLLLGLSSFLVFFFFYKSAWRFWRIWILLFFNESGCKIIKTETRSIAYKKKQFRDRSVLILFYIFLKSVFRVPLEASSNLVTDESWDQRGSRSTWRPRLSPLPSTRRTPSLLFNAADVVKLYQASFMRKVFLSSKMVLQPYRYYCSYKKCDCVFSVLSSLPCRIIVLFCNYGEDFYSEILIFWIRLLLLVLSSQQVTGLLIFEGCKNIIFSALIKHIKMIKNNFFSLA